MPIIKVSEEVKKELIRYAAKLQLELGRRVSLDEAIRFLLRRARVKKPELLEAACKYSSEKDLLKELYEERRRDEERARRRYGV